MTIYEAIKEMRRISAEGGTFSFSFMSYSKTKDLSDGIIEVPKARLRARGKVEYNQFAELQEEYYNVTIGEPRRFWHCCLLSFNGQQLSFSDK